MARSEWPPQAEELLSRFNLWRDMCKEQWHCATCPIDRVCRGIGIMPKEWTDDDINTMVRRFLHSGKD